MLEPEELLLMSWCGFNDDEDRGDDDLDDAGSIRRLTEATGALQKGAAEGQGIGPCR